MLEPTPTSLPVSKAPPAHGRDVVLGLLALVVAVGGGLWLARRPAVEAVRSPRFASPLSSVLLDERVEVGASGRDLRLLVSSPCALEIRVTTGKSASLKVTLTPPRSAGPLPTETDPVAPFTWTPIEDAPPVRRVVFAPGLYILRLELLHPEPVDSLPVSVRVAATPP